MTSAGDRCQVEQTPSWWGKKSKGKKTWKYTMKDGKDEEKKR